MKIKEIVAFLSLLVLILLLGVNIYLITRSQNIGKSENGIVVDNEPKKEVPEPASGYVVLTDTIVNSVPIHIYKPYYDRIELACGSNIPDGAYLNEYFYCVAGAFTGKGYEKGFDHRLIAGDHVSDGVRYNGYPCERNTGAFVYYNGHYDFLYLHYTHELDLAVRGKGMGFAQEMIIHNGLLLQTTRDDGNQNKFRALCEIDDALCVVETQKPISFGAYKDCLQALSVTEALYLDMGGWSYSWYRDEAGELHRPFPNNREWLTNALVFVGSK